MSYSEYVARARCEAETWLRRRYPTGRIVHNLKACYGAARFELATIKPDGIVGVLFVAADEHLAVVKKRVEFAKDCADEVWLVADLMATKMLLEEMGLEVGVICCFRVGPIAPPMFYGRVHYADTEALVRLLTIEELQELTGDVMAKSHLSLGRRATRSMEVAEVRAETFRLLRARPVELGDAPVFPLPSPVEAVAA